MLKVALGTTAAFVLLFTATSSNAEIVKNEMPACLSKELLDEISNYIVKEDKESYMPLLRSGQCIKLSPGMTVSVIDPGFFVSTIRYQGVKLYTLPKAIR